jgi:hypothetical protein
MTGVPGATTITGRWTALNGWCDACDKVLMRSGTWNDESEDFAPDQDGLLRLFRAISRDPGSAWLGGAEPLRCDTYCPWIGAAEAGAINPVLGCR